MTRTAMMISAVSLSFLTILPVQAVAAAQADGPAKSTKIKKMKVKKGAKAPGTQSGASTDSTTGGETASNVSRAIPAAAAHTNFFATPLGLFTAAGVAGGTAAGAAVLSSKGGSSSPS